MKDVNVRSQGGYAESQGRRPVRLPDVRSSFPRKATEVGFFVGMSCAALFGLFTLMLGFGASLHGGPDSVTGCVVIVLGAPLFGIFFAICCGATAHLLEAVVRGTANSFDPDVRKMLRALEDDEEDADDSDLEDESENVFSPESEEDAVSAPDSTPAPPDTNVTTPNKDIQP